MTPEGIRLNKYLASAGIGSRRGCDALVQQGEVIVNGDVCLNPGYRVQPGDSVRASGKRIEPLMVQSIVLHKPPGLVCSRSDENGRATIYELLPPKMHHLMHVGRLDLESEGLLILSNDGKLSQALTHPKHNIEKIYHVTVQNAFENSILSQFEKGVHTEVGKARASSVKRLSSRRMEMTLKTGLKRQIRYMVQAVGHRVKRLVRIRIGDLDLDNLAPGKWRALETSERESLLALAKTPRK
ncbi:rRNA pseudouridine synthase [bacterium]|jgi:23S rRNA pseudouridine2605 synthase|nr:rRNA pseudouridine synthase [bacterium]